CARLAYYSNPFDYW
nr:immunoglobulin heavy chain junction region [Mus musculus]MBK4196271.1 immunoglobulin heavy chain junction region [Mus musculus]MBK4196272.1 immunoglobulin heavy chain junction region [Mus musculus]MBK4196273.1 immunoglobulin heavy chain junction region [Mus musculus]